MLDHYFLAFFGSLLFAGFCFMNFFVLLILYFSIVVL